ncbi:alpha-glucosidase-like [Odontomachus brunneus]|uniref:alpha-glucosidase-like n=1 Tax=Odontomachus brunneus TaxID=486640 RepID=UPI0013F1B510|nr:alpha-glucosidase-like [Odontomachus brunneus]XP_032685974.1 alpha-glucosidase-like [Odontomachus brunneus]XP_032685975.1 alpha-glucosidase-like [Odontomachus brunneus]XP_032685976.1 alpha-glucosidase-like [Odontomachus brunneus]XP_032685977.1 alpha-glucosidase-like [Odontomachus brunneus]
MKGITTLFAILLLSSFGHGEKWWQSMSLYQIYPRSFKDSDGDGVGDVNGIESKLPHLVASGVEAFWLSPIYPSPMVDFGYDISDFTDVDPIYGTMADFEALTKTAHEHSLKVIMDFVPNHSSDQHEWFQKSLRGIEPYTDYYVWHKGKVLANGTVTVPNNWVSVFGGPAWTWHEARQAYYFHQFAPQQPDLNFNNEEVVTAMQDVVRFWLDKGVDGFRVDAVPHLCEHPDFPDEPLTGNPNPNDYGYTEKIYTKDQPRTYEMVRGWRAVLDEYSGDRVMMIEAYANMTMTMKYYQYGAHFPFNFGLVTDTNRDSTATDFKTLIDRWMQNMPAGATANWVAGNHDKSRLVSRYGEQRAQAVTMMTLLLPGVGVTYNGEEIGMEDTWISWEDTKDPQGCNAGKDHYQTASRDPVRTPFQWDDTTSAGFSTNPKTWLPVNENYKTVNLAIENERNNSQYALYQAVSALRKWPAIKQGNLTTKLLQDDVFGFAREVAGERSIYVVINFADQEQNVDLSALVDSSKRLKVYYATTNAHSLIGNPVDDVRASQIPASAAVIYASEE